MRVSCPVLLDSIMPLSLRNGSMYYFVIGSSFLSKSLLIANCMIVQKERRTGKDRNGHWKRKRIFDSFTYVSFGW